MAYNRIQAAKLLTAGEMEIFLASLGDRLAGLPPARLRAMVVRARNQRDKYRDLYRRQRLETRSRTGRKGGRSGEANERTARKAQVFAEALGRFEKRLARAESARPRGRGKPVPAASPRAQARKGRDAGAAKAPARHGNVSPKAPARGPSPSGAPLGPTSERARAARHKMQFLAAGSRAVQGHVSSLGRHNQAKRDRRGG